VADRYDLVIVGLGSAGLSAVAFADRLGLRVAAVDPAPPGGDCLWTGCMPSKTLIASGRAAQAVRSAERFGVRAGPPKIDGPAVLERIGEVQDSIADGEDSSKHLGNLGADIICGRGRVTGPHEVTVDDSRVLSTRFVLVATGARPIVPPIDGLADVSHRTTEDLWEMHDLPDRLIVLGGGPIALELSQAFARLGVAVTVLELADRVLEREDPLLVEQLVAALAEEGVVIETGVAVSRVERVDGSTVLHGLQRGEVRTWATDELLVATGRRANLSGLGLDDLGLSVDGPLAVDHRLRTRVRSVYAAGECTTRPSFTHVAGYDGVQAVRDMFLPGRGRTDELPLWVTFTEPELAHVGLTPAQAREAHGSKTRVHVVDLAATDRGLTDGLERGSLIVVTLRDRIVGAHVLAPAAGEMIHELALAVRKKMRLIELGSMVHAYPTLSMSLGMLAAQEAERMLDRWRPLVRLWLRTQRALSRS